MGEPIVAGGGQILIVEPDARLAHRIVRHVAFARREVVTATTVAAARAALDARFGWIGVVANVALPDGDGIAVLEAATALVPGVPLLLHGAGAMPAAPLNRAYLLGAGCASLDVQLVATTSAFVRRSLVFARGLERTLGELVRDYAGEHGFTPLRTEILAAAASGVAREDIADAVRISEPAAKHHVREMLRATGCESLLDLVVAVVRTRLAS